MKNNQIRNIQYLRGLASLMVVISHSMTHFHSTQDFILRKLGAFGVDIFFVISGFIMIYSTSAKDITPFKFMIRRIERVAPLYWIFTTLLILMVSISPDTFSTVKLEIWNVVSSYFFIASESTSSTFSGAFKPVLYVGWTLNYEMFFYLIFAFSLFLSAQRQLSFIFVIMMSLIFLGLVENSNGLIGFYSDPILLEFCVGVILGKAYVSGNIQTSRVAVFALFFAFLFFLMTCEFDWHRVIYSGIPASIVVFSALSLPSFTGRLNSALNLIGDASYSIYLSHFFTIGTLSVARGMFGYYPNTSFSNAMIFICVNVVVSTIVGIFVYILLEKKINFFLRRKFHKKGTE